MLNFQHNKLFFTGPFIINSISGLDAKIRNGIISIWSRTSPFGRLDRKPFVDTKKIENDLLAMFTASNNDGAGVKEELEKLSKMSSEESNAMIQAKLTETLSQMQVNSQTSSKTSLEDNLFQNIPGLTGGDSFDNLLPMMEGMMQSLLSKELLYTPMKDIADKFPDWLADNRNRGSEEEFIKYNKQFELTKKICFL